MSRLSVRLLLLVVCLAAIGGAAFHVWSSDRRARLEADATRQFNLISRTASAGVSDLRTAQQAYVAVGQGEQFWFDRVTAIHKDLEGHLAELRKMVTTPVATAALEDAAAALQDFAQMDQRARDYTRNQQLTLASDMIFADGIDLTKRAADAIAGAATAEQVARDAAAAALQRSQAIALAGAAGVAVFGLLLLTPGRRATAEAAPVALKPVSTSILTDLDDFQPLPRAVKAVKKDAPPQAPAAEPPPAPAARPAVNIGGVATLCNDLARISDTRALPALLERAASILNASGVILWIADPDGRELAPILVHGYSPQLATRLGTLAREAENLTASAYRTALLQTVKGDAISSGAIAVPLVAAGGCVGVMAAEVKNGGEQQEDLLAAATIVAAQLATLVGPPSARGKAEAAS
jgi:hypothetical protein